ncbi:hypothetical protein U9M48_007597 [Paspalum notatum var. saurae]|uniref:Uncharacterized protein n=1 Tax=Paspalum notatum var. saurae TaxID=547442 RepID=A0AAQ3WBS3_PASNO
MMLSMVLEPESWLPRYAEYLTACTLLGDDELATASVSADTGSMPLSRRKFSEPSGVPAVMDAAEPARGEPRHRQRRRRWSKGSRASGRQDLSMSKPPRRRRGLQLAWSVLCCGKARTRCTPHCAQDALLLDDPVHDAVNSVGVRAGILALKYLIAGELLCDEPAGVFAATGSIPESSKKFRNSRVFFNKICDDWILY